MSYSAIPSYGQPLATKGVTERTWYLFLSNLWKGLPAGAIVTLTPTASPYTYQASQKGFVVVQGGTVSLIQFTRDGIVNVTTGQTAGTFQLGQGDSLIITYSGLPNVTWVPL